VRDQLATSRLDGSIADLGLISAGWFMMSPARGGRRQLDADAWRRIGAVLDRVADLDLSQRPDALNEACRAEGIRVEDVRPFLEAQQQSGAFPERLDPAILVDALQALADDAPRVTLAPGTRLGPYEILSLIGVGGMGQVYRARDTRLDRLVALKHLSAEVATNREARRRFEREAHATSVLNHPHICTLHDVGEHEGVGFLVMELVDGESLAHHLGRGPLPIIDAVRYGAQMAEALAAAHRQGIVHRDLKPANIMLTAHGVKLLDFGLAVLRPLGGVIAAEPQVGLTTPGMILGTLQYMAPEQLEGRPADARADIFSLGAILYEMLTGRCAFKADSSAGVVAAVLNRSLHPLSIDLPNAPAALDWTVAQCLTKNPGDRWQHAADLAKQLRWIAMSRALGDPQPIRRIALRALTWLAAVAATAAGVVIPYALLQNQLASAQPSYRFEIPPPAGTSHQRLFAISPDGQRLAVTAADRGDRRSLWIHSLEQSTVQRVAGTEGALYPFWSPDGRSIGFFADLKLKIVELASGTVRILSDSGIGGGGTWNTDGVVLFADESVAAGRPSHAGLRRIAAAGGVATAVTRLGGEGPTIQAYPHFLPDGHHFLYMQLRTHEPGVYVGRLDGNDAKRILPAMVTTVTPQQTNVRGPLRATYAAGYLFYPDGKDGALVAQPFDTARLELSGEAIRIANDIEHSAPGRSAYDVSATGVLVYRSSRPTSASVSQLAWYDREGRELRRVGDPNAYMSAAVSPDGRSVLIEKLADGHDRAIERIDVTSGTPSWIVQGLFPAWSPDGKRLAYSSGIGMLARVTSVEGRDSGGVLFRPPVESWAGDWSKDGRHIVGTALRADTGYDIFATVVGSGAATYPVASLMDETDPRLSPDGQWLAYAAADDSRRWSIYVRPFRRAGSTWLVTPDGGRYPHWSPDGREILYLTADGTLMRTRVALSPGFSATESASLFKRSELGTGFNDIMTTRPYDVAPDHSRILMRIPLESPTPTSLIVLTNWRALVGSGS
jgi:serine/threonine protein kinase/Tol biopolymer transport system component